MLLDFLELAARNILHRKRRSWLTIIGIFIGIAAVVALISLGQGLNQSITQEFRSIGANKLFIQAGGMSAGSTSFARSVEPLTEDDLRAVRRTRGVAEAAGLIYRSGRVGYNEESVFLTILGVPANHKDLVLDGFSIEIAEGRQIRANDRSNVVIGSTVASEVFSEDIGVHSKITIQDNEYRVVGVAKPVGDPGVDRGIIMTMEEARKLFGSSNTVDQIVVKVQEGFRPEEVQKNVKRQLRQERNVEKGEEGFTVSTPQDLLESFRSILRFVQAIVVGIASISLLVGGVGIMNTMYTSVTDRTREIGIMKAVGATNRQILLLFLFESGIIGLLGGIIGVILGLGLGKAGLVAAQQVTNINVQMAISPGLILGSLGFAFLVGVVSGVLPARRAAKMKPVDALRYE